ncbi:MAG: PAQR family membrane homeostasis protein TrhA [Pseudomonadota bacterium]
MMPLRAYSRGEQRIDRHLHVVGICGGTIASVVLLGLAMDRDDARVLPALIPYVVGLLAMLTCSMLYHLRTPSSAKERLRRLDHAAIFIMIAGTYTPFTVIKIGGELGYGLLAFVWLVAVGGVVMKLLYPRRFEGFSIALYLILGWSILAALQPLLAAVSFMAAVLLVVGGVLYSTGVVFHLRRRLPYHNVIWHGFVLVAAACHYAAILGEVVPRTIQM